MSTDPRLSFLRDAGRSESGCEIFSDTAIEIHLPGVVSVEHQIAAVQAATLAMRLFDNVLVEVDPSIPSEVSLFSGAFRSSLNDHLRRLRPQVDGQPAIRRLRIGIGEVEGSMDLYIGSCGWTASVSGSRAQAVGRGGVGAVLAGTLAAAEAFKRVFSDGLRGCVLSDYRFSAMTLTARSSDCEQERGLVLKAVLFGCGSIGCGLLQAATLIPELSGQLTLVDNGRFDERNPFKYSLLDNEAASQRLEKATWCASKVTERTAGRFDATPFVGTAQDFIDSLDACYDLPLALCAVDTVEARFEVQDTLPKRIVNAGIAGTTSFVSSHAFDTGPCLACLGMQSERESWSANKLAAKVGLPGARVHELIRSNSGLTVEDLEAIKNSGVISELANLGSYIDQPLLSLYQRVAYAETNVETAAGPAVRVTTAFASAFAGLLLLTEGVKWSTPGFEHSGLTRSYSHELLGIPNELFRTFERDTSGGCLCASGFRQQLYREKYPKG